VKTPQKGAFDGLRLALAILTLTILAVKLVVIPHPWPSLPPEECTYEARVECGFIFDEAHYIRAVRMMMKGVWDVNMEHPPLAKLLIMLGILVLGDNPWGWRLIPALTGTASIYLTGLIAYELTRSKRTSLIAAALFGLDVACFNLSSIAILDPIALMFSLLGALLFLRQRWLLSGLSFGLALLSKLTTVFILASILATWLAASWLRLRDHKKALRSWVGGLERVGFIAFLVFIAGMWPYELVAKKYATPFEHLDFMLEYHGKMLQPNPEEGAPPLSWTNPILQFPRQPLYVIPDMTIAYYCLQTPLWWMSWLVFAFSIYAAILELRGGGLPLTELATASWFTLTYLIYFPISLLRPVYPFYFYMTVPAIAIGFSNMMREGGVCEIIRLLLLAAQIIWLVIFFPIKPQWLVTILRNAGLLQ